MEHWAKTVAKNGGVAAVTIQEGADRLRELETEVEKLKKDQIECGNWIGNKMLQPEWDSFKKSLEVINHWKTRAEKAEEQMNSTKINDGGPAFPITGEGCHNPLYSQPGMTMRDYFMAHAPNTPDFFPRKIMRKEVQVPAPENGKGWVKWGTTEWFEDDLAHLVRWRTTYADTMLAARKEDGK
jgi:hypothetical protein